MQRLEENSAMKALFCVMFLVAAVGLAQPHEFHRHAPNPLVGLLLDSMKESNVEVIFLDGRMIHCFFKGWERDSIALVPYDSPTTVSVPIAGIRSVSTQGSTTTGTIAGAIVGGVIGGLVGSTVKDKNTGWLDLVNEHSVATVGGVIIGAGLGSLIGNSIPRKRTTVVFVDA
jgi:hypothetical protein